MYKYSNKIDALTAILKKLDSGEQVTAELLTQEFHVGIRTIYRYLNHLQAAGYPVYYDKDSRSYRFLDNFRLNQFKPGISSASFDLYPVSQANGMAIATFRTSGECLHKNMAMGRLMGCSSWHPCNGNFRQLDWWREAGLLEMAEEVITGGHEVCRDVTLNIGGREHWVQAHMTLVERGNDTYLVFLAQDLSPRMYKEMQVARFFAAINQSPGLILVTDIRGTIEYVGERVEELTGYTAAELIGGNPRILQSGQTAPETYRNMWSTISRGYAWSGELYNRKKNGEHYWQHLHIAPIRNQENQICRFVGIMEDISRQKQLEQEIYAYAVCDRITGLYNRKIFLELGNRDLVAAQRYGRATTLLLVDLDQFKQFNDQHGYPAGNQILQQLAALCRDSVRSSDLIGRTGKDSFGILLSESGLQDAAQVAERIREKARTLRVRESEGAACTVSVAGLQLTEQHQGMEQLVTECEAMLQQHQGQQPADGCVGFA